MKRISVLLIFLISLVHFSCNFTVPESVSVTSYGAEYSLPLGSTAFKIPDRFSASEVQDALSDENSNIHVYEFNPTESDDAVVEYLMNYPVESQTISVSIPDGVDASAYVETLISGQTAPYSVTLSPFTAELDTGISFADILNSFAGGEDSEDEDSSSNDYSYIFDNIGFSDISAFGYIEVEGIHKDNASFTGKLVGGEEAVENWDSYADSANQVTLADSSTTDEGKFLAVDTDIDLSAIADEDGIITDDGILEVGAYSLALNGTNLTSYINGSESTDSNGNTVYEKHDNFIISYKLTPTVVFEDEEELTEFVSGSTTIKVNVNIVLRFPLKLKILNDIEIEDLLDMAGNAVEEDLLKRDDGEESDFADYADIVEKLECEYKFTNTTGLSFSAKIVSNEVDGEKIIEDKSIEFDGEKHNFDMDGDEIKNIFEKSPFKPKIYAKIDATTTENNNYLSITREAEFGAWAIFKATTGGSIEIWNKNDDEEE